MWRSDRGETHAYCTVCKVDFSVAGGGVSKAPLSKQEAQWQDEGAE